MWFSGSRGLQKVDPFFLLLATQKDSHHKYSTQWSQLFVHDHQFNKSYANF